MVKPPIYEWLSGVWCITWRLFIENSNNLYFLGFISILLHLVIELSLLEIRWYIVYKLSGFYFKLI